MFSPQKTLFSPARRTTAPGVTLFSTSARPHPLLTNPSCVDGAMATKKEVEQNPAGSAVQVDAASVFGASVQLPMFDRAEPDAWFILADANFNLRKVTDPSTKYWYVLSKFDTTTLRKLSTFMKQPRGVDPYKELREMLCQTYEPPKEQKLDALLSLTDIGDERPSEFVLELQCLASDATVEDFLKQILVRCLPTSIVTAITGSLSGDLRSVAKAADRAWTAAATSASASSAKVSAVAATASAPASRGNRRGGRQRGGCQAGGQTTALNLCGFHKRFGDSARRCLLACSRWGRNVREKVQPVECSTWETRLTVRTLR